MTFLYQRQLFFLFFLFFFTTFDVVPPRISDFWMNCFGKVDFALIGLFSAGDMGILHRLFIAKFRNAEYVFSFQVVAMAFFDFSDDELFPPPLSPSSSVGSIAEAFVQKRKRAPKEFFEEFFDSRVTMPHTSKSGRVGHKHSGTCKLCKCKIPTKINATDKYNNFQVHLTNCHKTVRY